MKMQPAKETSRQACRSLVQKAVRRGNSLLVEKVASHLYAIEDHAWLRQRVVVITYEECWPNGSD